jgi:DNA-binding MarR family transcriptional regulator
MDGQQSADVTDRGNGALTAAGLAEETLTAGPADEQAEELLNGEIMDVLSDLLKVISGQAQSIAASFGLTGSDAMALHKLDMPMSMKELSQRLGCDASFVTVLVDALEKHGLARREPSQRDRRSKNVVLTDSGTTIKEQITREVTARMPWCNALAISERKCFLGLLRKMLGSAQGGDRVTTETASSS